MSEPFVDRMDLLRDVEIFENQLKLRKQAKSTKRFSRRPVFAAVCTVSTIMVSDITLKRLYK